MYTYLKIFIISALGLNLLVSSLIGDDKSEFLPLQDRIKNRNFPSVFQAWNVADNLQQEDKWTTIARHDLIFHAPDYFGLHWDGKFQGLATSFNSESLKSALQTRKKLLDKNPNLIMLAELRYRDAHKSFLPDHHPWWKQKDGKPVVGWEEGGYYLLDFSNPEYQQHVSQQAKAIIKSGVFDGIMLDWWVDDQDHLNLIREIRKQIGDDPLILVNANDRQTPLTAPYVNGYFMECYKSATPQDWQQIAKTLRWAESNLKQPRINCLETWYHTSRQDLNLMRATTTLSLTLSNGYCLFSDPNPLPTPDHLHNWYDFWNIELGHPESTGIIQQDGSIQRKFSRGIALYNPFGNKTVEINFPEPYTSASTNKTSATFTIPPGDGDLFLKSTPK